MLLRFKPGYSGQTQSKLRSKCSYNVVKMSRAQSKFWTQKASPLWKQKSSFLSSSMWNMQKKNSARWVLTKRISFKIFLCRILLRFIAFGQTSYNVTSSLLNRPKPDLFSCIVRFLSWKLKLYTSRTKEIQKDVQTLWYVRKNWGVFSRSKFDHSRRFLPQKENRESFVSIEEEKNPSISTTSDVPISRTLTTFFWPKNVQTKKHFLVCWNFCYSGKKNIVKILESRAYLNWPHSYI